MSVGGVGGEVCGEYFKCFFLFIITLSYGRDSCLVLGRKLRYKEGLYFVKSNVVWKDGGRMRFSFV